MSIDREKIEVLKNILKELHVGVPIEEVKSKLKSALEGIPPFAIPLVEQELVKEGVAVSEILKLCDLHVELLRDLLRPSELRDVPRGHPLDLLSRENERISLLSEALSVYAGALSKASRDDAISYLRAVGEIVTELRRFRSHYRKIQMLIFPYLERRGITAVPRVLWGKEDQVMVKLRELSALVEKGLSDPSGYAKSVAEKAAEVSREISDLIFREEKILFPSVWALLSEGEWAAIHEAAKRIGYLVPVEVEWTPKADPLLPYEVSGTVTPDQIEKLPKEFKFAALATLAPDTYEVKSEGDLEFATGFLSKEEVEAVFEHLPVEITYADANDRVTFFSESKFRRGFARSKTIIGRRLEYCHPPRLENFVKNVVNDLKSGKEDFKEYWTRLGDRIIRVTIAAVRDERGAYLGSLEVVEDLTEVVNNPEEIKRKIIVL